MAVGELGAHDRFLAELGAQAGERAVGGVEIARRLLGEQTQLFAGGDAGFGAELDLDNSCGKLKRL
jgi:hypothetical protein